MKTASKSHGSYAVLYDTGLSNIPSPEHFSVDYWRMRGAVVDEAVGRGSAWFLNTADGPVVLRRYLRGGWAAKISRQRYIFSGVSRSRPYREYRILEALFELGLPVPKPVAAICRFSGLTCTGAIMTAAIPNTRTLAERLQAGPQTAVPGTRLWENVGKCIHRFHEAGVWHADLNVRNILIDEQEQVYLIDFDRAKYLPGKPVDGEGNLKRLRRSVIKFWPREARSDLEKAWEQLMEAYHGR